jgi:ABC-2 type transport system ATP-binding protein
MISAKGLTKQFIDASGSGELFTAVDAIDLQVPAGQVLALLGPNGAGKTTTVRMLSAILQPTAGWARIANLDVVQNSTQVRRHVGLLTEAPGLYERMKGREYLEFYAQLYRLPPQTARQRISSLMGQLGMSRALDAQTGTYSKGMKQKLALARAMLHDPPVLLLDEPTSAMDPHSAKLVRDSITELRDGSRAIIICTHNLAEAEALADRIAIIRRGQIIALGTVTELKANLLGAPLMELCLTNTVDGLLPELAQFIELESNGPNWVRYRTETPHQTNPQLLEWLHQRGCSVVTLSQVPQSLEAVYLSVVDESQPE